MKYLLVAQIDAPEKITSWEILPGDRDVSDFFGICLGEIKGADAKVNGFTCMPLDRPDFADAIERCEIVCSLP